VNDLWPYMRIKVRTEYIDNYPELLEAYKRNMAAALEDRWGAKAAWETFEIYRYEDDPLAPEEEHPWAVMTVEGTW
jgi:hypothetical protein